MREHPGSVLPRRGLAREWSRHFTAWAFALFGAWRADKVTGDPLLSIYQLNRFLIEEEGF